ncbi:MAG: hypothetical protein KDC45_10595, partial [Bacteroidetes bacterium]|nr:hypothetical protein [Bacteroidota bacterium]
LKTIGTQKQGIQELANGIQDHRNHMVSTGVLDTRRKNRIRHEMMTLLRERIDLLWRKKKSEEEVENYVEAVFLKKVSVYEVADRLFEEYLRFR